MKKGIVRLGSVLVRDWAYDVQVWAEASQVSLRTERGVQEHNIEPGVARALAALLNAAADAAERLEKEPTR